MKPPGKPPGRYKFSWVLLISNVVSGTSEKYWSRNVSVLGRIALRSWFKGATLFYTGVPKPFVWVVMKGHGGMVEVRYDQLSLVMWRILIIARHCNKCRWWLKASDWKDGSATSYLWKHTAGVDCCHHKVGGRSSSIKVPEKVICPIPSCQNDFKYWTPRESKQGFIKRHG